MIIHYSYLSFCVTCKNHPYALTSHGCHMVNVHSPGHERVQFALTLFEEGYACDIDICKVHLSAVYHENLRETILEDIVIFHEIHNSSFTPILQNVVKLS